MFKILHYRDKCIGCNICVEMAPDRWRMSKKDGKAVLLGSINKKGIYQTTLSEIELEANKSAAKACPVKVIQIR